MWKFLAAGDGDNPVAFALGALARDLTDAEHAAADAAGLLSEEAQALFEHIPDKAAQSGGGGSGEQPGARATSATGRPGQPQPGGKDGD